MHKKTLLPSAWQVPEVFRDRLGESVGRQRTMLEDGHLLLVLHSPPGPDDEAREGRFFWRDADGMRASTTPGSGHSAINAQLDEYEAILGRLDDQEEAARTADDYFKLMRQLNPLVRSAHNLHAAMQQAREKIPNDKRLINYRDRAYAIERQVELLAGDAKNALDHAIALRSEEQASIGKQMAVAAHRLNLLAAFFFPLATLTAIFGMNIRSGLETSSSESVVPFAAILGVGLLVGVLLALFVMRRGE